MPGSRTATAVVGLLVGLALSVALTYYLGNAVVLFLFLPFVPFLFRWGRSEADEPAGGERPNGSAVGERPDWPASGEAVRTCPQCGFSTRDPEYRYCPRDGRRLEVR